MSESQDSPEVAAARHTLLLLEQQADAVRAELVSLRRELSSLKQQLVAPHASLLVAANEQLVISALQADSIAETAKSDLDELARTSQRDVLTDTPNRSLMLDRLEHAIAMAKRNNKRIAVLFVDLDKFKNINDTQGHAVGDEVLQQTARRVESVLRDSDTVSRHGGDEFLVLLADISQPSDAAQIARKMLTAILAPCQISGNAIQLSASIGIALYPDDGFDAMTLIDRADAAMYCSKKSGAGEFRFYAAQDTGA